MVSVNVSMPISDLYSGRSYKFCLGGFISFYGMKLQKNAIRSTKATHSSVKLSEMLHC